MKIIKSLRSVFYSTQFRIFVLAFSWVAGMAFGLLFAVRNRTACAPIIVQFAQRKPSILILLALHIVPLLIAWFLTRANHPFWFCGIGFIRMMLFGYTSGAVYCAYASAGWLVCILMLFSYVVTTVLLFWITMKAALCSIGHRSAAWLVTLFAFLAVLLFDFFVLSPFFISLIH